MRWWVLAWIALFAPDAIGAEWLLFNRCGFKPLAKGETADRYDMEIAPNIGPYLIRRDWIIGVARIRKPPKLRPGSVHCTILVDKSGEWVTVQGTFAEVTKRIGYTGELEIK